MHARLRNDRSGEIREIKIGFSWTLLLFSSVFAIPLFMRRYYDWAVPMLMFSLMEVPTIFIDAEGTDNLANLGMVLGLGCAVFLGFKGNELTAKHLLKQGWSLEQEDEASAQARLAWSLF